MNSDISCHATAPQIGFLLHLALGKNSEEFYGTYARGRQCADNLA